MIMRWLLLREGIAIFKKFPCCEEDQINYPSVSR